LRRRWLWLDADGAVVHLNEPAEDMLGIGRNQAAGRSMRDLLKSNTELEGSSAAPVPQVRSIRDGNPVRGRAGCASRGYWTRPSPRSTRRDAPGV
jgi:hypothetical protein